MGSNDRFASFELTGVGRFSLVTYFIITVIVTLLSLLAIYVVSLSKTAIALDFEDTSNVMERLDSNIERYVLVVGYYLNDPSFELVADISITLDEIIEDLHWIERNTENSDGSYTRLSKLFNDRGSSFSNFAEIFLLKDFYPTN